jgi:glycine/D-amino acid oxidase-like deaminating enzyme
LWQREAGLPAWPAAAAASAAPFSPPAPDAELRCELLVIGAGITGCAAALEAADAGIDVLLVDAVGPGAGASGRNAGFLLLGNGSEWPAIAQRWGERAVHWLELARDNHARVAARFGAVAEHARRGSDTLAVADDAAEAEALTRAAALLAGWGVPCELPHTPHPSLRGFGPTLHVPEDGEIHPGKLIAAMAAAVRRRATLAIDALDVPARVATAGRVEVRFTAAVVATNVHAGTLVPELAPHLSPARGQVLATEPLPLGLLPRPVYACWGYDYLRQRPDGRIVLGGRRHRHRAAEAVDDPRPTDAVQLDLERYLHDHLPAAAGVGIAARWAGTMGFSTDDLPRLVARDGLAAVAGFTGHGMGLGAACGRIAARLALGAPLSPAEQAWAATLARAVQPPFSSQVQ